MEWLSSFWESLTPARIALGLGLFVLSLGVSFISIAVVMINVPPTYFASRHEREFLPGRSWWLRWSAVILKNILGLFLVGLCILLSLPGVPGQGILTILLGLIMLDIPGKRPLEARIIRRPAVLSAINKLREKYNRPPLIMD
jgi:hypothetical protein